MRSGIALLLVALAYVGGPAYAEPPRGTGSVAELGAKGDNLTDDTAAIQSALSRWADVYVPAGTYQVSDTLVLRAGTRLRGAGKGVTVLRMAAGTNKAVVATERFETLRGTAKLSEAPADITLEALTLDGGFLSEKWTSPTRRVTNISGSCLLTYARRMQVDIVANNCASHMLYAEGQGLRNSEEVASTYRLSGLGSGEECVVFRGAGDSRIEHLGVGLCGLKTKNKETQAERSRYYPDEAGFDGVVIDRQEPYEGTVEIGYAHIFAAFSGWGLRTRGNPRLHVVHLISESNLGGVRVSPGSWGAISLLDVHSNGKTASDSTPAREGLWIESQFGFSVGHATVARTTGSAEGFVGARLSGTGTHLNLTSVNTRNPQTGRDFEGLALEVSGSYNQITLTALRQRELAAVLGGTSNQLNLASPAGAQNTGKNNTIRQ